MGFSRPHLADLRVRVAKVAQLPLYRGCDHEWHAADGRGRIESRLVEAGALGCLMFRGAWQLLHTGPGERLRVIGLLLPRKTQSAAGRAVVDRRRARCWHLVQNGFGELPLAKWRSEQAPPHHSLLNGPIGLIERIRVSIKGQVRVTIKGQTRSRLKGQRRRLLPCGHIISNVVCGGVDPTGIATEQLQATATAATASGGWGCFLQQNQSKRNQVRRGATGWGGFQDRCLKPLGHPSLPVRIASTPTYNGIYNRWCLPCGIKQRRILRSLRRRLGAGGRCAVLQNHLSARIACEDVYFGQTALAGKRLEKTEFAPAKRTGKQSSVGHRPKLSCCVANFS
jgi:hypothetical protein